MDEVTNLSVARKIKLLRESHNYTQNYVADFLGISQNTYSLIERGITKLTVQTLHELCRLYKVRITDVVSEVPIESNQALTDVSTNFEADLLYDLITKIVIGNDRLCRMLESFCRERNR